MAEKGYLSLPALAKILGISRIAVYRKVKNGEIKAVKIGRNYMLPHKYLAALLGEALSEEDKEKIDFAVKKTVKEYGEVLKMLGRE